MVLWSAACFLHAAVSTGTHVNTHTHHRQHQTVYSDDQRTRNRDRSIISACPSFPAQHCSPPVSPVCCQAPLNQWGSATTLGRLFATHRVHSSEFFFFLATCAWEKEAATAMLQALRACESTQLSEHVNINVPCITPSATGGPSQTQRTGYTVQSSSR